MKFNKFLAIAMAATALTFSACSKDDDKTEDPTPTPIDYNALITGKDWRVTGLLTVSPGGTLDVFAAMPACEKDDLVEFLANGSITEKAGATKCDPADPETLNQVDFGLYKTVAPNCALLMVILSYATVKELTATTMQLEMVEEDMGITYTTKITMVKN
jgi:hypothetical protein